MISVDHKKKFKNILNAAHHKATPIRIAILGILECAKKPLSAAEIARKLARRADLATVYRSLDALTIAGVTRRVDLQHPHAHFELVLKNNHHHHIVCTSCGIIEDTDTCALPNAEQKALKKSTLFSSVQDHSFEFFGVCAKCS